MRDTEHPDTKDMFKPLGIIESFWYLNMRAKMVNIRIRISITIL